MKKQTRLISWPQLLCTLIYVAVGELFVLKYSIRFFPQQALPLCVGYPIVGILLLCLYDKIAQHFSPKIILACLVLTLFVMAGIQFSIDPYSLMVDRWSAIHGFLQNLLSGEYPYAAQTHLGGYGSPFPVWQLLHLPFYLIGNVGWSFVPVVLLFLHSLRLNYGTPKSLKAGVLLLASPSFSYEVMVRSDLLTNFLFVCALIGYFIYYKVSIRHHGWLIAITCGLLLSTRLAAIIPFCLLYFQEAIQSRKTPFIALGVLLVFGLTFLPFVLHKEFANFNPFVLQTRQGHISDLILLILCGILLALTHKQKPQRFYLHTAIVLWLLVFATFFHTMAEWNLWNKLFSSVFDITYFNMSLPFVVCAIAVGSQKEWGSEPTNAQK